MGYYVSLALLCGTSILLGWWTNDWWREMKEKQEEEEADNGTDR